MRKRRAATVSNYPFLASLRDDLIIGRRTPERSADDRKVDRDGVRRRVGIIPRREIAEKESARSRWTTYTDVYVQCYQNHSGLPPKIGDFDLGVVHERRLLYTNENAGELCIAASRFARDLVIVPISSRGTIVFCFIRRSWHRFAMISLEQRFFSKEKFVQIRLSRNFRRMDEKDSVWR